MVNMTIDKLYDQWCRETKRNGSILVGPSIKEFFKYIQQSGYEVRPTEKPKHI